VGSNVVISKPSSPETLRIVWKRFPARDYVSRLALVTGRRSSSRSTTGGFPLTPGDLIIVLTRAKSSGSRSRDNAFRLIPFEFFNFSFYRAGPGAKVKKNVYRPLEPRSDGGNVVLHRFRRLFGNAIVDETDMSAP